jgi:hypothetical protein
MNENIKKLLIVVGAILLTPVIILIGMAVSFSQMFIVGILFYLIECFFLSSSCLSLYLGG